MTNKFDLIDRTEKLGEKAIELCQTIGQDSIIKPLVSQFIRSVTSIGANYCEANEANSKKEFIHILSICKREAKESLYWLRMFLKARPECQAKIKEIYNEVNELLLIFSASVKTAKNK